MASNNIPPAIHGFIHAALFLTQIFLSYTHAQKLKNEINKYKTKNLTTKTPFKMRRWNDGYQTLNDTAETDKNETGGWLFKDYMKKFRPINVWERLYQKKKAQGLNASVQNNYEELMEGIDETDEILRLNLDPGTKSGRRSKWSPPGKIDPAARMRDPFSVRRRFYEMIIHTIYWTRNKMTVMQRYRKKFRNSKIYKMGYMTSKNDIACKLFYNMAYRAITTCLARNFKHQYRYFPIEMLHVEERLLNKWMDISLLKDLIERNDATCKEMLDETDRNREQAWVFYD